MPNRKVVQAELDRKVYDFVAKTAEAKGISLEAATRRALAEWAAREGNLTWNRLFDPTWQVRTSRATDAFRARDVLYRRRKR